MPRHIQNIESVMISGNNLKDFYNKLNSEVELLARKGLETAIQTTINSRGFYFATLTGYKVIKEWQ